MDFAAPSDPEAGSAEEAAAGTEMPEWEVAATGPGVEAAAGEATPATVATAATTTTAPAGSTGSGPSFEKTKTPRFSRKTDETTTITIRKKPGRKEKEKAWKSDTQPKRGRKSLKEITAEADLIEIPGDEALFSKQYYSIGDVGNMFRMNPTLIRTWSNEFEHLLQPKKNKKGDRYFRPQDVKTLHLIYHLIRVRKFTLEGAKEHLKMQKKKTENQFAVIQSLNGFRAFLLELKQNL